MPSPGLLDFVGITQGLSPISYPFKINKPNGFHLLESPLSKDQEVRDLDNEYEITATVVDTEQLNWWLRGFGEAAREIRKQPKKQ